MELKVGDTVFLRKRAPYKGNGSGEKEYVGWVIDLSPEKVKVMTSKGEEIDLFWTETVFLGVIPKPISLRILEAVMIIFSFLPIMIWAGIDYIRSKLKRRQGA